MSYIANTTSVVGFLLLFQVLSALLLVVDTTISKTKKVYLTILENFCMREGAQLLLGGLAQFLSFLSLVKILNSFPNIVL